MRQVPVQHLDILAVMDRKFNASKVSIAAFFAPCQTRVKLVGSLEPNALDECAVAIARTARRAIGPQPLLHSQLQKAPVAQLALS
jgi:hypothetical protein